MVDQNKNNTNAAGLNPSQHYFPVIVATRIHNRQAKTALSDEAVRQKIDDFSHICTLATAVEGVIAVDGEDLFLVNQITKEVNEATTRISSKLTVLPVAPWGRFVPALNALIGYAAAEKQEEQQQSIKADGILFVSAETKVNQESIDCLFRHMVDNSILSENPATSARSILNPSILVVGARLAGHDYHGSANSDSQQSAQDCSGTVVELNGRTTPWNTLSLWNLKKLAMTGFPLISEGHLTTEPSYGVEEVVTIALLQKLLGGEEHATAKLVAVPGVDWDSAFGGDADRQEWHERKMNSKRERAERQMNILQLTGKVHHY